MRQAEIAGGAPARSVAAPAGCEPAGPENCIKLLETLTVQSGGATATTGTVFQPAQSYRFVITGSVSQSNLNGSYDAFYCFGGQS